MSLFKLEKEMKLSKRQLKRIIREEKQKLINESVHSHLDGELTNVVFAAAQEVNETYAEITVDDVQEAIAGMPDEELAVIVEPSLSDYFVQSVRQMTYEDIVDKLFQLVDMGILSGGYEDFFEMVR